MKSNVSLSVLLHPHLELIASKVIMEEKAGGFCGIFLRAIRHFCLQLITRTQHQEARKVYKALRYSVNINSFCHSYILHITVRPVLLDDYFLSIPALLRTQIAQLMIALNI